MRPVLLAALVALASCSSSPGERWRKVHPGFVRSVPSVGQEVGEVVASLEEPEGARRIRVSQWRFLGLERDPWAELDGAALLEGGAREGERTAVIARRQCLHWAGVRRVQAARASWLLFRGRRLVAFDHWEFGDDCAPEHHFLPAGKAELGLERDLGRFVARRFPENVLGPGATFRKGLVYLEHDREEDARAMLTLGDRALSAAARSAREDDPDAPSETELGEARAVRAELSRALRALRGFPDDPEALFWEGH